MLVIGVDVGAATAKAAVVKDGEFVGSAVMPTGDNVIRAAEAITEQAVTSAGYKMADMDYVVSTGYARHYVKFADKAVSEIICHAKGANYMLPAVRTIIDIGGQDSKVIHVRENGTVADFIMNDKCAAGTGRFLEVMAGVLNTTIDQMGAISLTSDKPSTITSTCTIFAETECVSLRAEGTPREDMISGLHKAVARRVYLMGQNVGYRGDVAFTGGVAQNNGLVKHLMDCLNMQIVVPEKPQIMGALGAALLYANTSIGKDVKK